MLAMFLSMLETDRERQKFMSIYDGLGDKMYRVALAILRDENKAQDAVQESYRKIIVKFSKIDLLPAEEIEPYVVTIIENTSKDMLRRAKRLEFMGEMSDDLVAKEDIEAAHSYRRLVNIIKEMPEQLREVLLLRFVEEESVKGVAKRLGLSESQVSNRLARGRVLLKERLGKEGYVR